MVRSNRRATGAQTAARVNNASDGKVSDCVDQQKGDQQKANQEVIIFSWTQERCPKCVQMPTILGIPSVEHLQSGNCVIHFHSS